MELMILKALLIIIPLGMVAVVLWYLFYVVSYSSKYENELKEDSCTTDKSCNDDSRKPGNE